MPMMLQAKAYIVSPTPMKTPSSTTATPYSGSVTATMRSTVVPSRMTLSSGVNMAIIRGASRNSVAPDTAISVGSSTSSVRVIARM